MDEGRFEVGEARGVVTALAEVRVLVDGAGDQAGDFGCEFGIGAEDEGEGGREGGGGLHGWEGEFGDVVGVGEAECALYLVVCGAFAHFANVSVESGAGAIVYEVGVDEEEGFGGVEADGYDVHCIL